MRNKPAYGKRNSIYEQLSRKAGRTFPLCLAAALLITAQTGHAQPQPGEIALRVDDYSTKYDDYFRHYSLRYFGPFIDWRWFKAQAVAESLLNPKALSIAGARGVMQLLPRTFAEVRMINPSWNNIHTPRWNIAAGIYYSYTLYQQWNGSLHGNDRFLLTLASYNAGFARVRYAYAVTDHVRAYEDIRPYLPNETRAYVDRIQSLMEPKAVETAPVVTALEEDDSLTAAALRTTTSLP